MVTLSHPGREALSVVLILLPPPDFPHWSPSPHTSPLPQGWSTERCWTRWSGATGCPARPSVPSPCTTSCASAGGRSRRNGPPSSTCRPSWRTTSRPPSPSTSPERTYRGAGCRARRAFRLGSWAGGPLMSGLASLCLPTWIPSVGLTRQ